MPINYALQSVVSEPGTQAAYLNNLPSEPAQVAAVAQGLVYHYAAGKYFFGYEPPQARMGEADTRDLAAILALIVAMDERPLSEARDFDKRMVGCCRDFALIACAILRHNGIPARLRYGFANYLIPGYWVDHVVVECWTGARWRRFDAQLANVIPASTDLLDLQGDTFISGGRAWQLCRQEGADPALFGLGPDVPEISGLWFVRGRLLLDLAALHKQEMLCWDEWSYGAADFVVTPEDEALLDRAAQLSLAGDLEPLTALWEADARLHLPDQVICYSSAVGPHPVTVR